MAYLQINGVTIPASKCDVTYSDVDYNSGRTADGVMHRNRVRSGVVKASIATNALTVEQTAAVLTAASGAEFEASVFSPRHYGSEDYPSGQYPSTFYCGDQSASVYSYNYDGNGTPLIESCSFDIIEV